MINGRKRPRRRRRQYRRRLSLPIVAFVVVAVGVGIATSMLRPTIHETPLSSIVSGGSPVTFYLDGLYGAEHAGEMLAAKRGHFANSGVNVVLRPAKSGEEITALVARNRAVGVTTGQKFLLARWRSEKIVAFGASFLDTPTAIFVPEQSGLRTPKDLVGKRLSYQPGSEDAIVFDAMMVQLGLPRGQIRHVPTNDGFAALRRGEVDAVVAKIGQQPLPSDTDPARYNVIKPQDYGIHVPGLVYFASSDLAASTPSAVTGILRGVILGWLEVYADPAESAAAIAQFDPKLLTARRVRLDLAQQRDLVRPAGTRIADYDESRWRTLRDILLFAQLGEESVGLSAAVRYDFLRDVYRRPLALDPAGGKTPAAGEREPSR